MEENRTEYELSADTPGKEQVTAPEYIPSGKYDGILYSVYKNQTYYEMMRISCYAIAALTAYALFMTLVGYFEAGRYLDMINVALITGVPFVTVSALRHFINAPRPYELFEFYEKKPKKKFGRSFPSRHVFSIFVIGTVIIPENVFLGIGLLVLGVILAVLRVLMGLHFIRDVAAGGAIGVVSGVVGILITSFI